QDLVFSLGTNIDFAAGLVKHYGESLRDVRVHVVSSYGAYVVASSLEENHGDIGIAQADAVYFSYRRGTSSDPRPHTALRGIAVLGMNPAYILVRSNSAFHHIHDLKSQRIGVLEPGTSSEVVARILLEAHGLRDEDVKLEYVR